jgi:hypothetical protein
MLELFDAFGGFQHVAYCLDMHFVSSALLGLLGGLLACSWMLITSRRNPAGNGTLLSLYFCSSTGAFLGAFLHWIVDYALGNPF